MSEIECTIPVLPVRDLPRSLAFYAEVLGFKCDWGGEPDAAVAGVSRDGKAIMLAQRESFAEPGWVWIGLKNDALFEIYRAKGVKVRQEPKNFPWAYEMKFEDIDGNVLWLGTEPREDLPLES